MPNTIIPDAQLNAFLEDDDENIYAFTLKERKSDAHVVLSILDEFDFDLQVDCDGHFTVSSTEDLLEEWVAQVQAYCDQGSKDLTDVLMKCSVVYQDVIDDEDVDLDDDDHHTGSDDDMDIDPDILGEDDPFAEDIQPSSNISKHSDKFNQQDLDEARQRFRLKNAPQAAVNRLMKDYILLTKQDTAKDYGFTALPIDTDLFHWEVRLFGFDPKDEIEGDLRQYKAHSGIDYVLMDMKFPKEYPFKPPFIRVVKPRLQFHTGHVTIGGSICMELLTPSGWMPSNSIESILIQIRMQLVVGKGRIDFNNTAPYTEQEAHQAFDRVARQHNWI